MKNCGIVMLVLVAVSCSGGGSGSSGGTSDIDAVTNSNSQSITSLNEKVLVIKKEASLSGHSLSSSELDYLKSEGLISEDDYQQLIKIAQK